MSLLLLAFLGGSLAVKLLVLLPVSMLMLQLLPRLWLSLLPLLLLLLVLLAGFAVALQLPGCSPLPSLVLPLSLLVLDVEVPILQSALCPSLPALLLLL
jgi:hypothetical protein